MTAPTPSIDYAALKSGGIIMQKDDDFFALRLRLPVGSIPADLLPRIAAVAKKYGRGEVSLTARAGIEIPWMKFKEIEAARKDLAGAGLTLGPCGPRFRTVTACPGLPVCRRALADSQSFARQIDQKFSGWLLPHKFKATVSACPNACSRPLENEIRDPGRLRCFNALDMSFFEAVAEKRKDCAVCGDRPEITKIEQKNYVENRLEECGL